MYRRTSHASPPTLSGILSLFTHEKHGRFLSSIAAGSNPRRGGRHREDSRLATLIENRLLQLTDLILKDDQSSIDDQIAAIKGEVDVLRSRGLDVPKKGFFNGGLAEKRLMNDFLKSAETLFCNFEERLKFYRREAEREKCRTWLNMNKLEKLEDRRFLVRQVHD